jgi:FKBP-type peptidyl-prolyl cis-trans isomerase
MAYAVGLGIGQRLRAEMRRDGLTADHDLIVRGLVDGLNDLPSLYPEDEMLAAVAKIEAAIRTRRAEQLVASDPSVRKLVEENLRRSRAFLEQNAKMTGVEVLPGGVQVRVLKAGDGKVVGNSKWVVARFEVALADGTVVDASDDEKPARVPTLRLPPAVLEAIRPMRVGSRWQVALPPEQAHGLAGRPPVIGPNQALLIDVELAGVE